MKIAKLSEDEDDIGLSSVHQSYAASGDILPVKGTHPLDDIVPSMLSLQVVTDLRGY